MAKIGINGFGRIGRLVMRAAMEKNFPELEFVGFNDIADAEMLAYLLKYDSNYGTLPQKIEAKDSSILVEGKEYKVMCEKDPKNLPWKDLDVDIVIESTGLFREREQASLHLEAGAKKVVISAPAKGEDVTLVLGVNESDYNPEKHKIISNASCTTNCLGPLVKVLDDNFGVTRGLMTTIHSYTNDQKILDSPHKDPRRARAAALASIPTTTGAAKAIGKVIPKLNGKMNGLAIRIPTSTVSIVDLVAELENATDEDTINNAYKEASQDSLKGILKYSEEPLVSRDFVKDSNSCIYDAPSTYLVEKNMVKVLGWYDNEWAYSCRVVDLLKYMVEKGNI